MSLSGMYLHGTSELRMGKALRDGYRQRVFLMTKIGARTNALAAQQLEEARALVSLASPPPGAGKCL
jgi:aryl-alcohol dehydrogenase-like predicted oxidoreductase